MESSSPEQVPQRRMRLAVLCTVAILVLGTTFALYRHIQNNSQGAIAQEAQTLYEEGRYDGAGVLGDDDVEAALLACILCRTWRSRRMRAARQRASVCRT